MSAVKHLKNKRDNFSLELSSVKHNLLVNYGEFGAHLPDVDCIIYNPKTYKVLAVLSSKVTLRERIAQTGYWKIKMSKDPVTRHVKVFFITPDEDGTLTTKIPAKKGRAIAEVDLDGSDVMSERAVEESSKVKTFDKFSAILLVWLQKRVAYLEPIGNSVQNPKGGPYWSFLQSLTVV